MSVATTTVVSAGQSESCGPRAGGVGEVENVGEVVGDDEGEGLGPFVGCNVGLFDGTPEGAENGKRENRGHTL